MKLDFAFIFPANHRKVDLHRPGGFSFQHIADLVIKGEARILSGAGRYDDPEERYEFDLHSIEFEGKDILPLMEAWDITGKIEAACFHHIHQKFSGIESDYQDHYQMYNPLRSKVISLPLRRKIR